MSITHPFVSGKADSGDSTLVNASNWNATHAVDVNGINIPVATTIPSTPATGIVTVFNQNVSGRMMPAGLGPSGLNFPFQPYLGQNRAAWGQANGAGSTTISSMGLPVNAIGTITAASSSTTTLQTTLRRAEYLVTTASTSAIAGWRSGTPAFFLGSSAGWGGLTYVSRWGPATGTATTTSRCFVGMQASSAAPTDVNPSTLVSMFGFGWDDSDTNIQFMNKAASGTVTKTNMGSSFPRPTADRTKAYETAMFSAPNSGVVSFQITDLATGAVGTGSVSTNLPATTTFLCALGWTSVGGTSSVIGFSFMSCYLETDL